VNAIDHSGIADFPAAAGRLPIADGHWKELPHRCSIVKPATDWIPAFAGMTGVS